METKIKESEKGGKGDKSGKTGKKIKIAPGTAPAVETVEMKKPETPIAFPPERHRPGMAAIIETTKLLGEKLKELAAIYYVLAMHYALTGQTDLSACFGRRCIETLRAHGDSTLSDCALSRREICGIPLPELIHRELVTTLLSKYGVKL
jgi:hypothetical protein